jgi:glutathione synthase/RimK-type ligase-like ATP-grasp enzyme
MLTTLFVVDNDSHLTKPLGVTSFNDYLRDYPKLGEQKTRIINLCDIERYLSQGYYCSLLAEARGHSVFPSVKVINALRSDDAVLWFEGESLKGGSAGEEVSLLLCMGEVVGGEYTKIARRIFQELPAPLLHATLMPESKGLRVKVSRASLSQVSEQDLECCLDILDRSSRTQWRQRSSKKYRWDLAILVDDNEKVPPSNKGALSRFVKAGAKLGIRAQLVNGNDLVNLNQFDGLFIRETTAIDHHTYRLAYQAEEQGLMVIDDTDSILRCCNKVFLHDAFNYQKVPSLKTEFISDSSEATLDKLEQDFGFPLVLKLPEGSFSKGVFKIKERASLKPLVDELLEDSALVLAQEYLYTEYDWRIGVLHGRALYACRYYMARNHWQIYNHGSSRNFSGGFDALPTFEVPRHVLQAALQAAAVVGTGLYGIDIKEVDGRAYVLEVNDNPNIDHGVEDAYLGEELYMQVMSEFLRRFEQRG